MKKETAKKSKLWIVLVIVAALLLVAGGIAALFLMGPGEEPEGPKGGRAEIYWNVDRVQYTQDSAAGLSTREPGEDGLYHIRFAIDGGQVEYACADKKVVNRIDMNQTMGLVFDADGVIVDMVAADTIATCIANSMYVRYMENGVLTVNSSIALNGMELELPVTDVTGIYDCTPEAEVVGQVGEPEAMDLVIAYQNDLGETTHVFIADRVPATDVYWRVDQYYNSSTAQTTRVPDENDVYTIRFAANGKQVDLKCKDRQLVNTIDAKKTHNCAFGLTFDAEGYINGILDPGLAVKGAAYATNMDVTELTDTSFVAMKRIPGTGQGSDYEGILTPDTKVYNVNTTSEVVGEPTELQMGDRLFVLANTKGEAQIIFVTNRMVDSPMYYNPSVKYDSTNRVTKRVPDSQGRYVYDVYWGGGEHKQVWTKNIDLASQIDSYKYGGFGLKLGENDEILDVYYHTCIHGYSYTLVNMYITNISNRIIAGTSYYSGAAQTGIMTEDCKVYDYSDMATVKGEETVLRQHDRVITYRDFNGQIKEIHIVVRQAPGTELYYNLGRKYDSTKKVTTREPEGGWYVFTLAKDGKQVTAKTSSKEIATKIDSYSPAAVALRVENGIIYECWPGHRAFVGGFSRTSNYIVREIDMNKTAHGSYRSDYTTKTLTPNVYRNIWTPMAEDVKVYNVSQNFRSHRGEETTLQLGDKIHAIRAYNDNVAVIFVIERDISTGPAASVDYKYNEDTGETTRKPDAEGYYVYTIARDGKVGTYKTKDKALASKIDSYGDVFAFTNNGDIITNVLDTKYIKGIDSETGSKYDVHAYGNGKITIKKNRPTASDAFKEYTFDVSSNVQVIDFTPGENFGQKGQVSLGDRIVLLRDDKKVVQIICILQKNTREAGHMGICPDCGENVFWEPWTGGGFTTREGYHYYLAKDVERANSMKFSNTEKDYKVVLDLNGKTLTTGNRIASVLNGEKLVLLDSSKDQTGVIQGVGPDAEGGGNGGGLLVYGGHFELYGGTVRLCEENLHNNKQGGVLYIGSGSTAKLMGGKIIGTDANTSGGAVHIAASDVQIGGDVQILGGVAPKGNSVYVTGEKTTLSIADSAVITGGMQVGEIQALTISGKPQITAGDTSDYSLKLTKDHPITLGALEQGAKIGITAAGAFTQALDSDDTASKYAEFFYSDDEKKTIIVENKQLVAYQPPMAAPDAVCQHCGETVQWLPWSGEKFTQGGHYYAAYDVSLDAAVSIGDTESEFHVVLDLNGCTVSSAQSVFMVRYGEKLTLLDSSAEKTGTCIGIGRGADKNAGVLQAYNDGKNGAGQLEVLGGTYILTEGSQTKAGGVIHANDGCVVTVRDATLRGGIATATGGVIYAKNADVTIGGKTYITGGQSAAGDNIYTEGSTKLTIEGEAKIDGGVEIVSAASVTLAGKPVIEKTQGGSAYGMKLTNASPKLDVAGLEEGAKIGVTADGIFTKKDENADTIKNYFVSDDSGKPIQVVGGAVSAGEDESYSAFEAYCAHCDKTVTWVSWDGASFTESGHFVVPEGGLTIEAQATLNGEHAVVVDLAGQTVKCTENKVFYVTGGGDLTIMDSKNGGTVIGTGRGESKHAGTVQVYNDGKLTILGGTFMRTADSQINRGGVIYGNTGTELVIQNATIVGGAAGEGGAIYASGAKLTIGKDAVIKAGTAPKGDTIYATATATVTVEDATIEGGVQLTETVGAVKLIGKVNIEKTTSAYSVKIAEGVKLDVTGLAAGSVIGITKAENGAFTTDFADEAAAEAAKGCFVSDDGTTEITLSGKALSFGVIAPPPAGEMAECAHCGQTVQWHAWDGAHFETSGHYYVPEGGLALTGKANIASSSADLDVIVDLRGQSVTSTEKVFYVSYNDKLTVIDSVGGGTVIGTGAGSSKHAGVVQLYKQSGGSATVHILGGTFKLAEGTQAKNGGVFYANATTELVIKNATVEGGKAALGAAIWTDGGNITIGEGAIIKAGTATTYGDSVYLTGTANVTVEGNARIEGGVYVTGSAAGCLTVKGQPVIEKTEGGSAYSLKGVIAVGALEQGAKIAVSTEGVFTTEFADEAAAEAAKGFFAADDAAKEIAVEGKALKTADKAVEPEPTEPSTEPSTEATEPSTEATEPSTEATEPSTEATEPSTEATEPSTEATEPSTEATEPSTAPTEPAVNCPHCEQAVEWTVWDGASITASGHYVVPEGGLTVEAQASISSAYDVVVDLAGQTISCTANKMFYVANDAHLTIIDSSPEKTGTVIGTGRGASKHAGVIQVYKDDTAAKLTILGGTYKLAEGSEAKNGGVIYANAGCEVTVKNATIEGGKAVLGAAIWINGAKATIGEGAVIKAGTATTYGDSVYVTADTSEVIIEGNARIEGGVYITGTAAGKVTVKGQPVIEKTEGGSAYSLKGIIAVGALEEGAKIAVSTEGVFTTEFADEAAAGAAKAFFAADDAAKEIALEGKALKTADKAVEPEPTEPSTEPTEPSTEATEPSTEATEPSTEATEPTTEPTEPTIPPVLPDGSVWCPHCEQYVMFTVWDGTKPTESGHLQVQEGGVTVEANSSIATGLTVVIDLNGQTLQMDSTKTTKMFLINTGAKMVFLDSKGEGQVIGSQKSGNNAGIIQVYGGDLDIYGGTFKMTETSQAKYGGIIYGSKKTTVPVINIYGGEFFGTTATMGGVLSVGNVKLNIEGGTFHAGTATNGDTICIDSADAELTLSGEAVIEGGVEIKAAALVSVAGKVVVKPAEENGSAYGIKLAEGLQITVGELEQGAFISVTAADGTIATLTDENGAAAAAAYFKADDAAKVIKAEGANLVIAAA